MLTHARAACDARQSPLRGTLRAACFLQRSARLQRAPGASATPGAPHRRAPLPKVDSRASVASGIKAVMAPCPSR